MDINIEIDKLNIIVNNKKIPPFKKYKFDCLFFSMCSKVAYLMYVLELTYKHPEIETYLEQLLRNFNIAELNNINYNNGGCTILHQMVCKLSKISLNSFEIIINFGINVNSLNDYNNTALHCVYQGHHCVNDETLLKHEQNIVGLLVKHGANLNILNYRNRTMLDKVIHNNKFDKYSEIIIMTVLDFGARTNNPNCVNKNALEFIESYLSNSIKPAIKK